MSKVQDYLWAAKALPAMAKMPVEELVRLDKEAMSLSRQEVIMQWGSPNAKIWLAMQEWVGSHILREFILKGELGSVERWWDLKKQVGSVKVLRRDDFVECLAERNIDLVTIVPHVRTERGQMCAWEKIVDRMKIQGDVQALAREFCTTVNLGKGVKREIRKFLKMVILQDTKETAFGGFTCLHEDESFKVRDGGSSLAARRVNFLSASRTNTESAFMNIVTGLVTNPYVSPEETAEIVDLCLSHGTWFAIPFLGSNVDEKDAIEISTVKKIWDRAIQRMKQVQIDEKNWEYLCSGEQITIIHSLGIISRSGNKRMLDEYLKEAVEFFPSAVLTFASRWSDDIVAGIDQGILSGGLMDKEKAVREAAIKLAARIKESRKNKMQAPKLV